MDNGGASLGGGGGVLGGGAMVLSLDMDTLRGRLIMLPPHSSVRSSRVPPLSSFGPWSRRWPSSWSEEGSAEAATAAHAAAKSSDSMIPAARATFGACSTVST